MKKLSLAAVAFLLLLVSPSRAFACSCAGAVPLCQSFWQADAVFAGQVMSFKETDAKNPLSARVATVRVDRAWRGQVSGTVEVRTGAGGADCGYSFKKGKQYVIYAYKAKDGALRTSICSPTKELARAAADLEYLKTIDAPSAGGRIYGVANVETKGAPLAPAKDAPIALKGASRSWTSSTDDKGAFEFTDLPAGEYTVAMEGSPLGPAKVQLRDVRACAVVHLWAPGPPKHP